MKILALIGSPRKQGNTDIMADEVLEGAKSMGTVASKIYLDEHYVRLRIGQMTSQMLKGQ